MMEADFWVGKGNIGVCGTWVISPLCVDEYEGRVGVGADRRLVMDMPLDWNGVEEEAPAVEGRGTLGVTIGSDGGMSSRSEDCLSGVIAGVVDDSLCKRDGGEEGLPIIPKLKPVFSSTLSKDGSFVCIWTSRCRMCGRGMERIQVLTADWIRDRCSSGRPT